MQTKEQSSSLDSSLKKYLAKRKEELAQMKIEKTLELEKSELRYKQREEIVNKALPKEMRDALLTLHKMTLEESNQMKDPLTSIGQVSEPRIGSIIHPFKNQGGYTTVYVSPTSLLIYDFFGNIISPTPGFGPQERAGGDRISGGLGRRRFNSITFEWQCILSPDFWTEHGLGNSQPVNILVDALTNYITFFYSLFDSGCESRASIYFEGSVDVLQDDKVLGSSQSTFFSKGSNGSQYQNLNHIPINTFVPQTNNFNINPNADTLLTCKETIGTGLTSGLFNHANAYYYFLPVFGNLLPLPSFGIQIPTNSPG